MIALIHIKSSSAFSDMLGLLLGSGLDPNAPHADSTIWRSFLSDVLKRDPPFQVSSEWPPGVLPTTLKLLLLHGADPTVLVHGEVSLRALVEKLSVPRKFVRKEVVEDQVELAELADALNKILSENGKLDDVHPNREGRDNIGTAEH
jgi:hypothetical protein